MTTTHFLCSKSTTIFQHISLSKALCKGTEIILFYQTFAFFSIPLPFFLKIFLFFPNHLTFPFIAFLSNCVCDAPNF